MGQGAGSLGRRGAERHLPWVLPDSVLIRTDWGREWRLEFHGQGC